MRVSVEEPAVIRAWPEDAVVAPDALLVRAGPQAGIEAAELMQAWLAQAG